MGTAISSNTALLSSIAVLTTKECISKLKTPFTKLGDFVFFSTLLCGKVLKNFMLDKKFDEKEAFELKKMYNHYLNKRSELMKTTEFKVEDNSDDVAKKIVFSLAEKIN